MCRSSNEGTRKGFTLVELAVVIVIIGVLAAFGVPRFIKSVERSKAAEAFSYLVWITLPRAGSNGTTAIKESRVTICATHRCVASTSCCRLPTSPDILADLLRPVFPQARIALPIEDDRCHVAFEWIGQENYLGERVPRGGRRTRGANFTSADAAVLLEQADGRRHMILIELKYTESYGGQALCVAQSGTDRTQIYQHLYDRDDCPIAKGSLPGFDALFYEPFYQFMRQQFLAHEMERVREKGADIVSVLHIAPAHNRDFLAITSPGLRHLGNSAVATWKTLVPQPGAFVSVSTEQLFAGMLEAPPTALRAWADYIAERYSWVRHTG